MKLARAKTCIGAKWKKVELPTSTEGSPKGGGYQALYPATWKDEVTRALKSGQEPII